MGWGGGMGTEKACTLYKGEKESGAPKRSESGASNRKGARGWKQAHSAGCTAASGATSCGTRFSVYIALDPRNMAGWLGTNPHIYMPCGGVPRARGTDDNRT